MSVALFPLILIMILFLIVPVIGLIVLQVYLSKMEKDWPGLILPGLFFATSLIVSVILLFLVPDDGTVILRVLFMFVMGNSPAIVFFIIYKSVHKKQIPTKELDKMTIHDLS